MSSSTKPEAGGSQQHVLLSQFGTLGSPKADIPDEDLDFVDDKSLKGKEKLEEEISTPPKKVARKLQMKKSPQKPPLRCVLLNTLISEEKPYHMTIATNTGLEINTSKTGVRCVNRNELPLHCKVSMVVGG